MIRARRGEDRGFECLAVLVVNQLPYLVGVSLHPIILLCCAVAILDFF